MLDDYGQTLDSLTIQNGLRELNPGFHFDLAAAVGQLHPFINQRQGVYVQGTHICSMDRGMCPEFKVWQLAPMVVEVPWSEADKEDVWVQYVIVDPSTPGYDELCLRAARGNDPEYAIRTDGKLMRMSCRSIRKVPNRVIRVGWRHVFERILLKKVPGVTRANLAEKFHVDMSKMPYGTLEAIRAAIFEE